jgi:hypothetical protein
MLLVRKKGRVRVRLGIVENPLDLISSPYKLEATSFYWIF